MGSVGQRAAKLPSVKLLEVWTQSESNPGHQVELFFQDQVFNHQAISFIQLQNKSPARDKVGKKDYKSIKTYGIQD